MDEVKYSEITDSCNPRSSFSGLMLLAHVCRVLNPRNCPLFRFEREHHFAVDTEYCGILKAMGCLTLASILCIGSFSCSLTEGESSMTSRLFEEGLFIVDNTNPFRKALLAISINFDSCSLHG